MLSLFNDNTDENPPSATIASFGGLDAVTRPSALPGGLIRAGKNVWMDVDGVLQTRPALKFNSMLNAGVPGAGPFHVQGMGYYDIPAIERIMAARDGKLYAIPSAGNNVAPEHLAGPTPAAGQVHFSQLVGRMFWCDGVLNWSLYNAGWSHGQVTAFSDASAMPPWSLICSHGLRLLALDPATDKIHASAVGQADAAADWVKTQNLIVGDGTGDPTKRLLSSRGGNLLVLKESSAWQVDARAANVANWTSIKITGLTGCVEGKTAVEIGQDVYFLSRYGVVSLGQLATTDSIEPATTLSARVQPFIDRINWQAIGTAWATAWRNLYILALPIDADTFPTLFLCYNTVTKQWQAPWEAPMPPAEISEEIDQPFAGYSAAIISRFGGRDETLLADNAGRVFRFDETAQDDEARATAPLNIESWATLKAFDFDAPDHMKQPFWLWLEFFKSTATGVQINLVRDGFQPYPDKALEDCEIIAADLVTNNLTTFPLVFPLVFQPNEAYKKSFHIRGHARFQEASIQVVSLDGRLRLRFLRMAAFLDTPVLTL